MFFTKKELTAVSGLCFTASSRLIFVSWDTRRMLKALSLLCPSGATHLSTPALLVTLSMEQDWTLSGLVSTVS